MENQKIKNQKYLLIFFVLFCSMSVNNMFADEYYQIGKRTSCNGTRSEPKAKSGYGGTDEFKIQEPSSETIFKNNEKIELYWNTFKDRVDMYQVKIFSFSEDQLINSLENANLDPTEIVDNVVKNPNYMSDKLSDNFALECAEIYDKSFGGIWGKYNYIPTHYNTTVSCGWKGVIIVQVKAFKRRPDNTWREWATCIKAWAIDPDIEVDLFQATPTLIKEGNPVIGCIGSKLELNVLDPKPENSYIWYVRKNVASFTEVARGSKYSHPVNEAAQKVFVKATTISAKTGCTVSGPLTPIIITGVNPVTIPTPDPVKNPNQKTYCSPDNFTLDVNDLLLNVPNNVDVIWSKNSQNVHTGRTYTISAQDGLNGDYRILYKNNENKPCSTYTQSNSVQIIFQGYKDINTTTYNPENQLIVKTYHDLSEVDKTKSNVSVDFDVSVSTPPNCTNCSIIWTDDNGSIINEINNKFSFTYTLTKTNNGGAEKNLNATIFKNTACSTSVKLTVGLVYIGSNITDDTSIELVENLVSAGSNCPGETGSLENVNYTFMKVIGNLIKPTTTLNSVIINENPSEWNHTEIWKNKKQNGISYVCFDDFNPDCGKIFVKNRSFSFSITQSAKNNKPGKMVSRQSIIPVQKSVSIKGCAMFICGVPYDIPETQCLFDTAYRNETVQLGPPPEFDEAFNLLQNANETEISWEPTTGLSNPNDIHPYLNYADIPVSQGQKIRYTLTITNPQLRTIYHSARLERYFDYKGDEAIQMCNTVFKCFTQRSESNIGNRKVNHQFNSGNIDTLGNKINMVLYPNPTNKILNILLPKDYQTIEVKIFDLTSKVLVDRTFINNSSLIDLDISSLASGAYICNIIADNSIVYKELFNKID